MAGELVLRWEFPAFKLQLERQSINRIQSMSVWRILYYHLKRAYSCQLRVLILLYLLMNRPKEGLTLLPGFEFKKLLIRNHFFQFRISRSFRKRGCRGFTHGAMVRTSPYGRKPNNIIPFSSYSSLTKAYSLERCRRCGYLKNVRRRLCLILEDRCLQSVISLSEL